MYLRGAVVFHNWLNYDYHFFIKGVEFIIKEQEFKMEFRCLGKNSEKRKTFSVPIIKEQNYHGKEP